MKLDDAARMARDLMDHHGLKAVPFEFDGARKRAGACHWRRVGSEWTAAKITLSRALVALWEEPDVRNTILHEIAHALTPGHKHDAVWAAKAREIGCDGARCYDSDRPAVPSSWEGSCPDGHRSTRERRPTRLTSCGKCSRRFDLDHLIAWSYRGRPMTPSDIGGSYLRDALAAGVTDSRPALQIAAQEPPRDLPAPRREFARSDEALF